MELLLETFCLLNGKLINLPYHKDRIERTLGEHYPITPFVEAIEKEAKSLDATTGKWRASVTYSLLGIESVKLIPYRQPQITGFKLIPIQNNFYSKKWADRTRLNQYKELLPPGIEPIFILDGQVTDTSFTNLLFERKGNLYTPSTPLLRGTKRSQLLDRVVIIPIPLLTTELASYEKIHLINAMLNPGDFTFPISAIIR